MAIRKEILEIRKLFISESKNETASLVIQHCLISLYNPTSQTYKDWDMKGQSEWFVRIGHNTNYKHEIRLLASYENIEQIAKYIITGDI